MEIEGWGRRRQTAEIGRWRTIARRPDGLCPEREKKGGECVPYNRGRGKGKARGLDASSWEPAKQD